MQQYSIHHVFVVVAVGFKLERYADSSRLAFDLLALVILLHFTRYHQLITMLMIILPAADFGIIIEF